jgi:hypothetical protein
MKPKIIGLIGVWYAEKWIAAAIEQALQYCDEVVVAVGANSKVLSKLQDNTAAIVDQYKDRITLLKASTGQAYSQTRADTLNRMLAASQFRKVGNWIWILDADEFYFDCSYQRIREAIKSGLYNHIRVEEKFFFINMTRYLRNSHGRLFRISQQGDKFQPTQHWSGDMSKRFILKRDNDQQGMFHYSLLTDITYRRLMWETEHIYQQPRKLQWLSEIYVPYDLNNEEIWITKNQKLFGHRSPFLAPLTEVRPNNDGKLFVYNGPHPPHIETTGLPQIPDFRKI